MSSDIIQKQGGKRSTTKIVTSLLKKFINIHIEEIDDEITKTLKFIAKYLKRVDRCALFLFTSDRTRITNTHEWVSNRKYSKIHEIQDIAIDVQSFHFDFFLWGESHLGKYGEPPGVKEEEIKGKVVRPKAQLYIPINSQKRLIGTLGLTCFEKSRTWTSDDTAFLAMIGEIIVSAIQRKTMEAALFKSEKYYRSIINSIPIAMHTYRLTGDGKLTFIDSNPAARKLLGQSKADLHGKKVEETLPEITRTALLQHMEAIAKSGGECTDEIVLNRGEGIVNVEVKIFQTSANEVVAAFSDISERKEAERVLELENIALRDIDKMRQEFIATTTHELKTPLSSIVGASEFLLTNYKNIPEESVLNLIDILNRGSNRLRSLIEDLLILYRMETRKFDLSKKTCDLVQLTEGVIKDLSYLVQQRKHTLKYNLPETCIVEVDSYRIEQVITNLLSNAIKNTPPSGHISIVMKKSEEFIEVCVVDDGVGLTEEEKSKIFVRFSRIDREGIKADVDIQGTGLGLYISKVIIKAHGGEIWGDSDGRYKGSKFCFKIPVKLENV
ncbi:MAG: sensor histidine kinase [Promethearchaeota archaeon]